MSTTKSAFFTLIASFLALQACRKKDTSLDLVVSQVQVSFVAGSIDFNAIDSVTVTLQKNGTNTSTTRRLIKGNLIYSLNDLNLENATWKASVAVYATREPGTQASHVYGIEKNLTQSLTLTAPTGKLGSIWSPRLMVDDQVNKVQIIVAERQDDPYFALNAVTPTDWGYLYFERGTETSTGNVDELMAYEDYDEWIFPKRQNVVNTTSFAPYASKMKGKEWMKGYFFVMMFKKTGLGNEEVLIWHRFNRRPE